MSNRSTCHKCNRVDLPVRPDYRWTPCAHVDQKGQACTGPAFVPLDGYQADVWEDESGWALHSEIEEYCVWE